MRLGLLGLGAAGGGGGAAGMTNPMDGTGQMIYGASAGAATKVPSGISGSQITTVAGVPTFVQPQHLHGAMCDWSASGTARGLIGAAASAGAVTAATTAVGWDAGGKHTTLTSTSGVGNNARAYDANIMGFAAPYAFEARMRTVTTTGSRYCVRVSSADFTPERTPGAARYGFQFVRDSGADANWVFIAFNNGTNTEVDTGVAWTVDTWDFRISWDGAGNVRWAVKTSAGAWTTGLVATNVYTAAVQAHCMIGATPTAANTVVAACYRMRYLAGLDGGVA